MLKAYGIDANARIILEGEDKNTNVMCESPYHLSWWEWYPNCLTVFLRTKIHHFLGGQSLDDENLMGIDLFSAFHKKGVFGLRVINRGRP